MLTATVDGKPTAVLIDMNLLLMKSMRGVHFYTDDWDFHNPNGETNYLIVDADGLGFYKAESLASHRKALMSLGYSPEDEEENEAA